MIHRHLHGAAEAVDVRIQWVLDQRQASDITHATLEVAHVGAPQLAMCRLIMSHPDSQPVMGVAPEFRVCSEE